MQALISIQMAFALAVHLIFGCCSHHFHRCQKQALFQLHCSEEHSHRLTPTECTHEEHEADHVCNMARCVVILNESAHTLLEFSTGLATRFFGETAAMVGGEDGVAALCSPNGDCPIAGNSALPVQTHLMHQVMLL